MAMKATVRTLPLPDKNEIKTRSLGSIIDDAILINKFRSDRELARKIGVANNVINGWRRHRIWPNDANMIELSRLALMPADMALLNRDILRSKSPEARARYFRMSEIVAKWLNDQPREGKGTEILLAITLFLALTLAPSVSKASPIGLAGPTSILYIMENYVGNGGNA